ncbi:MAG: ATP-binding protein [Cyanobacteria bacterium P01_G01_bin.67]
MLNTIPLFKELSLSQRVELLQTGTETCFPPGEILFHQGDSAEFFYIVTQGTIKISRKINNRELLVTTYSKNNFFGEIALLGEMNYPYSGSARSRSCVYFFDKDSFWHMIASFPSIRKIVLSHMGQRIQELQIMSQSHEKFMALGTLAAGLAHELNNPASAAHRAVSQLQTIMSNRYTLLLKYMEQHLTSKQMKVLLKLKQNTIMYATKSECLNFSLDPMIKLDLEDRLVHWLEEKGVDDGWKLASSLLVAGINPEQLEEISEQVATDTFKDLLTLLETMVTEASLLNTLDHSVERVSELVEAVKNYSYLDKGSAKQSNINVNQGLENTLAVMGYQLEKQQILIKQDYANDLPLLYGNGATLNQVWSNLIDNAIYAIGQKGIISIRTFTEDNYVIVEIADNGPGIPPEVQNRIFEPFFTTKEVGTGTGIGLSLAFRIVVREHHGDIRCFSQPGYTCFRVCLPIN